MILGCVILAAIVCLPGNSLVPILKLRIVSENSLVAILKLRKR